MQDASSEQQTKQKYKPNHQHTGLPPHSALPIRRKTNKQKNKQTKAQTTEPTLGGQKPKGRKNSTLKPYSTLTQYIKKKMKRQRNTTQMKEKTRSAEVQIDEEEIGKLPEKQFRIITVKMIRNLENRMEKMQESINKDL